MNEHDTFAQQTCRELAGILAAGYLRLQKRRGCQPCQDSQITLDKLPDSALRLATKPCSVSTRVNGSRVSNQEESEC